MKTFKRIGIITLAILLVFAAGATAHHLYEQRLSSSYAPIFKTAMMGSDEERPSYIREARAAMHTDKDREVEAKLEKMQKDDTEENTVSACAGFEEVAEDRQCIVAGALREAPNFFSGFTSWSR
jgi:hypothetical protein